MKTRICLPMIALAILLAGLGCGDMLASESPSDVVTAVYMAASDGNDAEVQKRLAAPPPANVEIIGTLASGGRQRLWEPNVEKGSIESVEILSEEATSYRAEVGFRLHMGPAMTPATPARAAPRPNTSVLSRLRFLPRAMTISLSETPALIIAP